MTVTFWGVRGSASTPGKAFAAYGGHTPCVELRTDGHVIIFDAGSGIIGLGDALAGTAERIDILLTHAHYDHLEGLPFFKPLFDPAVTVRLWSGHMDGPQATKALIQDFMRAPFFPVGPDIFRAKMEYCDFRPGDPLPAFPDITVRTTLLNHPGGGVGYRIDRGGRAFCYLTDHEHGVPEIDTALLAFAAGADLIVYDAMYTDENYAPFVGYGHSTWQQALRFSDGAGVKRCVLFHHNPDADDATLAAIEKRADAQRPGTLVAREGLTLSI